MTGVVIGSRELVTVVVPARNAANWIAETLTSVLAQTHSCLEVLVVDDRSTDATAEVVRSFVDTRLRMLQGAGAGVAAARNMAAAAARGTWLAFCDADDLWQPEKLSRQLEAARIDRLDLVATNCHLLDRNRCLPITLADLSPVAPGLLTVEDLLRQNVVATSSVLLRREPFNDVGGFADGAELSEDWFLWLRLLKAGCRGRVLPCLLTSYRLHDESSSARLFRLHEGELHTLEQFVALGLDATQLTWVARRRRVVKLALLSASRETDLNAGERCHRVMRSLRLRSLRAFLAEAAFAVAPRLSARRRPRLSAREAIVQVAHRPSGR